MKHGRTTSREENGQSEPTSPLSEEPAKPITFVDYDYWEDGLVEAPERVVERVRAQGMMPKQQPKPD